MNRSIIAAAALVSVVVLACSSAPESEAEGSSGSLLKANDHDVTCVSFAPTDAACKSVQEWRAVAKTQCSGDVVPNAKNGAQYLRFAVSDSCGGDSFSAAAYDCCAKTTNAPAPEPACFTASLDLKKGCQTNDALRAVADLACSGGGATVSTIDYKDTQGCADGSSRDAKFTCCAPAP